MYRTHTTVLFKSHPYSIPPPDPPAPLSPGGKSSTSSSSCPSFGESRAVARVDGRKRGSFVCDCVLDWLQGAVRHYMVWHSRVRQHHVINLSAMSHSISLSSSASPLSFAATEAEGVSPVGLAEGVVWGVKRRARRGWQQNFWSVDVIMIVSGRGLVAAFRECSVLFVHIVLFIIGSACRSALPVQRRPPPIHKRVC
jgi:hypothetical protein